MAVPGNAPADLAATELFAVDAYATEFDARIVEVDADSHRIRLDRTAFYPSGGGQPSDLGTIQTPTGVLAVSAVRRDAGAIWHTVEGDLPEPEAEVHGVLDRTRRHQVLIRTSANLIPQTIDPLRIIDIVGLDKQADGGTHVLSTAEVVVVRVTGTESKGKDNKRIRLEVLDAPQEGSNDA